MRGRKTRMSPFETMPVAHPDHDFALAETQEHNPLRTCGLDQPGMGFKPDPRHISCECLAIENACPTLGVLLVLPVYANLSNSRCVRFRKCSARPTSGFRITGQACSLSDCRKTTTLMMADKEASSA